MPFVQSARIQLHTLRAAPSLSSISAEHLRPRVAAAVLAVPLSLALALVPAPSYAAVRRVPCDPAALIAAMTNPPAGTVLSLAGGCNYSFTAAVDASNGGTALPPVTASLTIEGHGATLARRAPAPPFRLLSVEGGSLTLTDTTVTGGAPAPTTAAEGTEGGGIYSSGSLTLIRSHIVGNEAAASTPQFGGAEGGGVFSTGPDGITLRVEQSVVADNSARATSTSAGAEGGGIFVAATFSPAGSNVDISGSQIEHNVVNAAGTSGVAAQGGGIFIHSSRGSVRVTRSTLSGNLALATAANSNGESAASGGGMEESRDEFHGSLSIDRTLVNGNQAEAGGGLEVASGGGLAVEVPASLTAVQLTGNNATANQGAAKGGGLFARADEAGTAIVLTGSLVTANSATTQVGSAQGGGVFNVPGASLDLVRTIVTANNPDNCSGC